MRFKVYISQVWTYTKEIEADNKEMADEIAGDIAAQIDPMKGIMRFGEDYVDVEPILAENGDITDEEG